VILRQTETLTHFGKYNLNNLIITAHANEHSNRKRQDDAADYFEKKARPWE